MSEALDNEQHPGQIQPARSSRSADEERAWSQLYAAIHQASAAKEVVEQLDADQQSKRNHLALYIRAKTTLREQKAIDARNQRIGSFVRQALTVLVVAPIGLLRNVLSTSMGVAVAMLPPVRREPAKARTPVLKNDPDFARAKTRFSSSADGAAPAAGDVGESRKAA
jgi:hypothetical protein